MLDYALDQYIEKDDFEYLIYSTADIIVPNNLFKIMSEIKDNEFCALVYPNSLIVNSRIENSFWPHFGIDLIIFKISKKKAIFFKEIIKNYDQYDWGVIENFYISIAEALNLKIHNLFKKVNVIKFNNDFQAFTEDRTWQINSWKENQKYFINFLKKKIIYPTYMHMVHIIIYYLKYLILKI